MVDGPFVARAHCVIEPAFTSAVCAAMRIGAVTKARRRGRWCGRSFRCAGAFRHCVSVRFCSLCRDATLRRKCHGSATLPAGKVMAIFFVAPAKSHDPSAFVSAVCAAMRPCGGSAKPRRSRRSDKRAVPRRMVQGPFLLCAGDIRHAASVRVFAVCAAMRPRGGRLGEKRQRLGAAQE